jgi:hypothetical protein
MTVETSVQYIGVELRLFTNCSARVRVRRRATQIFALNRASGEVEHHAAKSPEDDSGAT